MATELTPAIREAVESLFKENVTKAAEVVERLAAKKIHITRQQVGGLWSLWVRKQVAEGKPAPVLGNRPQEAANKRAARDMAERINREKLGLESHDGFSWTATAGANAQSALGFGQSKATIHVNRIAPTNDGFLGIEDDLSDADQLGRKYGSGTYDLVKYINDTRVGTTRVIVARTYGEPRTPRNPSVHPPRLVAHDPDDPNRTPRQEDPRNRETSGGLSEMVSAVKSLKELAEEGKPDPTKPREDVLERLMREQAERDRRERDAERERENARRAEERERWERMEKEREAAHQREILRIREEAAAREARDKEYRSFMERNDQEREKRLQKALEETAETVGALQAGLKEELEKGLAHQKELLKLERERLENDRARDTRELALLKEHQTELFQLQKSTLPGAGPDKATEMIVGLIQNALAKCEEKANQIIELKKIERLISALGPENAQQLAASFMKQGGIDIASFIGGRGPAAPRAGAPTPGPDPAPGASAKQENPDPKGEGMNGIAASVYNSPFFADLVAIWAGHLRMHRKPYLFANQLCGYMVEDRRVELFYNYMAGLTWAEFLAEIRPRIDPAKVALFESPEAAAFFDAVIDLVAQRIEQDHIARGIVPGARQEAGAGGNGHAPAEAGEPAK